MADINSWTITGRLTKDAEYRVLASGKALLTCSVAVNTGWGEYKKTAFVKVSQWGERGAKICQYLTKGKLIGATGQLSLNTWQGKDGQERSELALDTQGIQLLAGGDGPQKDAASHGDEPPKPSAEDNLDDIPF